MADFDAAFEMLLGNEGTYTVDDGGATMWGITEAVARRNGYTGAMQLLPQSVAKTIAQEEYWEPMCCDAMPQEIAFNVFDACYNGGPAIVWLQKALGVAVDGVVGPATRDAVKVSESNKVVALFNAARLEYYTTLVAWNTYGKGWVNRIANNLRKTIV